MFKKIHLLYCPYKSSPSIRSCLGEPQTGFILSWRRWHGIRNLGPAYIYMARSMFKNIHLLHFPCVSSCLGKHPTGTVGCEASDIVNLILHMGNNKVILHVISEASCFLLWQLR